jgi:hypothetical protein
MKQPLLTLAFFAGLAALLLHPVLFGDRALVTSDLRDPRPPGPIAPWTDPPPGLEREPRNLEQTDKLVFFHPKLTLAHELIARGEAPLWNPYTLCGTPLLASAMPSTLYPLGLFRLSPWRGYGWAAALHLALAALFAWGFLRALGLAPPAALFGGLAWAFSGWFLVHLDQGDFVYVATWLPAMLLAAERVARGSGPVTGAAGLALATGLAFVAGFPPVAILSLYLAVAWLAVRLVQARAHLVRRAAAGAAGLALGLLLAAVQVLPTWELSKECARTRTPLAQLKAGALPPAGLLLALVPDLFGHPVEREGNPPPTAAWLSRDPGDRGSHANYMENTLYVGVAPLLLALIALRRPRGPAGFLAAAGAIALCGATGSWALDLFHRLPGLQIGSVKRLLVIWTFAAAALGALGLDALLRDGRRRRWPFAVAGLGALGAVAAAVLLRTAGLDEGAAWPLRKALYAALFLAASALAIGLRPRLGPAPTAAALFALTAVELLGLGWRYSPWHRPDQFAETEGLRFLREAQSLGGAPTPARVMRYGTFRVLPPDTSLLYGIPDAQGWDVLITKRYGEVMEALEPGLLRLESHRVFELSRPGSLDSPILDLLAVRYVLVQDFLHHPDFRPVWPVDPALYERERFGVYENRRALPRAFLVPRGRRVEPGAAARELAQPGFDPRAEVLLEEEPPPAGGAPGPLPPVAFEVAEPHHLRMRARAADRCLLFLSDLFYPGWEATVDGAAAPVLRANHAFRAVALAPGEHVVEFRYRPATFRVGAALSLGAALAVAGLLAAGLVRRRGIW